MTATLPREVQQVFHRFASTEFTTVDGRGQPITWPLTPQYRPGDPCIDLTTEAEAALDNPKVGLLFSDPTGCGMDDPPQILVQGVAQAIDPGIRVRPERVYVWPGADVTREPQLFDAHMEEVRSGHDEEPAAAHAGTEGGGVSWDERIEQLGTRYPHAVVSLVAPDGFPFSVRLPVELDRAARRVRVGGAPVGVPWQPGLACVTAYEHGARLQVRGDLVEEQSAWAVIPHQLSGDPAR